MPGPRLIAFRLTSGEHFRLAAEALSVGLAPAAWCRRAVLEQLASAAQSAPATTAVTTSGVSPAAPAAVVASAVAPAVNAPLFIPDAARPFAAAAAATAAPIDPSEPLSRVVGAKLTPSQYFDLEARAKASGMTIGTYLRHLVQGQPPTARWPLARAAIVQLSRAGNNLNQLVKLAHQGAPLSFEIYGAVERVLAEVRAVRRALQEEPRG